MEGVAEGKWKIILIQLALLSTALLFVCTLFDENILMNLYSSKPETVQSTRNKWDVTELFEAVIKQEEKHLDMSIVVSSIHESLERAQESHDGIVATTTLSSIERDIASCNEEPQKLPGMMKPAELRFFKSFFKPTSQYLEYGSGGSTDTFGRLTTGTIVSVENFKPWCSKVQELPFVKCREKYGSLHYHCTTPHPTVMFGYPAEKDHNGDFDEYINVIEKYPNFDIVLIDGRWRVACALKALDHIKDDTVVLVHDTAPYKPKREFYDAIFEWYDVIGKVNSLVAMRRKKNKSRPDETTYLKYKNHPEW